MSVLLTSTDPASADAIPLHIVTPETWREAAGRYGAVALRFAAAQAFDGGDGALLLLPGRDGHVVAALFGDDAGSPAADGFGVGRLAQALPEGTYRLASTPGRSAERDALAFALGGYRFTRYRSKRSAKAVRLVVPSDIDAGALSALADAVAFGRDLINMPANDLGPAELEAVTRDLATAHGAALRVIVGDALLDAGFAMVHAVGRAASRAPRLIDLTWGMPSHPRVTLVGKGVCFDSGGLNVKTDAGMLLMKKDMGGAATALTIARLVMEHALPIRLRVIIPAVENAISGAAFRPGDVLRSRKGLTVEIGNTDAEGRLILADALALAEEDNPELLLDFATLTGAARVALGPDLPAFYTDDEALAGEVTQTGLAVGDPVWRMPLWNRYDSMLASKVADLSHVSGNAFAGSVTAALFLRRFVGPATSWAHFDIFGWVPVARPARPEGGEPQTARLVFELLCRRWGA